MPRSSDSSNISSDEEMSIDEDIETPENLLQDQAKLMELARKHFKHAADLADSNFKFLNRDGGGTAKLGRFVILNINGIDEYFIKLTYIKKGEPNVAIADMASNYVSDKILNRKPNNVELIFDTNEEGVNYMMLSSQLLHGNFSLAGPSSDRAPVFDGEEDVYPQTPLIDMDHAVRRLYERILKEVEDLFAANITYYVQHNYAKYNHFDRMIYPQEGYDTWDEQFWENPYILSSISIEGPLLEGNFNSGNNADEEHLNDYRRMHGLSPSYNMPTLKSTDSDIPKDYILMALQKWLDPEVQEYYLNQFSSLLNDDHFLEISDQIGNFLQYTNTMFKDENEDDDEDDDNIQPYYQLENIYNFVKAIELRFKRFIDWIDKATKDLAEVRGERLPNYNQQKEAKGALNKQLSNIPEQNEEVVQVMLEKMVEAIVWSEEVHMEIDNNSTTTVAQQIANLVIKSLIKKNQ